MNKRTRVSTEIRQRFVKQRCTMEPNIGAKDQQFSSKNGENLIYCANSSIVIRDSRVRCHDYPIVLPVTESFTLGRFRMASSGLHERLVSSLDKQLNDEISTQPNFEEVKIRKTSTSSFVGQVGRLNEVVERMVGRRHLEGSDFMNKLFSPVTAIGSRKLLDDSRWQQSFWMHQQPFSP